MTEQLKSHVLYYLREEYRDDPSMAEKDTQTIADEFGVPLHDLYNHSTDTGVLFDLMQEGKVHRYGPEYKQTEGQAWSWIAAGAEIVWR